MKSLTIKLEPDQDGWLEDHARNLRRSKGAIIRELIERHRAPTRASGIGERLGDLCGCLEGSRDLSTRTLEGYGRH